MTFPPLDFELFGPLFTTDAMRDDICDPLGGCRSVGCVRSRAGRCRRGALGRSCVAARCRYPRAPRVQRPPSYHHRVTGGSVDTERQPSPGHLEAAVV